MTEVPYISPATAAALDRVRRAVAAHTDMEVDLDWGSSEHGDIHCTCIDVHCDGRRVLKVDMQRDGSRHTLQAMVTKEGRRHGSVFRAVAAAIKAGA